MNTKKKAKTLPHPALEGLEIEVGYDNSNPQNESGLRFERNSKDQDVLIIDQELEVDAPTGYSFHLNVAVVNKTGAPQRMKVQINWQEPNIYDYCRDYMYIGYDEGSDWRMLAIGCANGVTDTEVVFPVGKNFLCCTPKFDVADYLALLDKYAGKEIFERIEVGTSAEGYPVAALRCGSENGKTCIITTRAHGYETAGAHCMAGFFADVTSDTAKYSEILKEFNLYFLPMINVDAVAKGRYCRAPSGVNFGKELAVSEDRDRGARELREFILEKQPFFYLDMHNNTGPHVTDAFRSIDAGLVADFAAVAPDHSRLQKVWNSSKVTFDEGYLINCCNKQFGTIMALTEFPWYTRTVPEMEMHGRDFFKALFELLTGR
jgi:hypothetical protein